MHSSSNVPQLGTKLSKFLSTIDSYEKYDAVQQRMNEAQAALLVRLSLH